MATPTWLALAAVALSAALGGCTAHYVDGRTDGTNKVGARTVQLDVFATLGGCATTTPAAGQVSVDCSYQGPGSLAATSRFTVRDVPAGTPLPATAGALLLQVPASATGFSGTYTGSANGPLVITPVTAPLPVDGGRTIVAEAGTKLVLIDSPPALGTYRYVVDFAESGAAPSPLPVKVLFVAKLTAGGHTHYLPALPCTHDFAAIPALLLPTLNMYAPIDLAPVAGQKGCANAVYSLAATVEVVEFYHQGFDHYFITWGTAEIAALDAGTVIKGWTRTGHKFKAFVVPQANTQDVCRFYIPPELGDSHFFGRGATECADTKVKFPALVEEDPKYMQMVLPAAGVCPAGFIAIYRVFSGRVDANHRYMIDRALRDLMVAAGWVAEGDGPDLVVMCAPA